MSEFRKTRHAYLDMVGVTGSIPVAPTTQSDADGGGDLLTPNIERFPSVGGLEARGAVSVASKWHATRFALGCSSGRFQKMVEIFSDLSKRSDRFAGRFQRNPASPAEYLDKKHLDSPTMPKRVRAYHSC